MIQTIAFDFASKTCRPVEAVEIPACRTADLYCWVDIDTRDGDAARRLLDALGVDERVTGEVLGPDQDGRYDSHIDCLHFEVTEATVVSGDLITPHMKVLLGQGFMATLHREPLDCLTHMHDACRGDFLQFSKSSGFLLYEMADGLLGAYRKSLRSVSDDVEKIQLHLFGETDDAIFMRVSELTRELLMFRKAMMAARELLHEMAVHRSMFVPESTQPFLETIAASMERLCDDLSAERDVLSESLNLYMGMVSHRTNKVLNRLMMISVLFLPLTFLTGVYGMNLRIPETSWKYGYLLFWCLAAGICATLVTLMKRRRWL